MKLCLSKECSQEIERLRDQLKLATEQALVNAMTIQALRDKQALIEKATLYRAADICRAYAHSKPTVSMTRRQVAYACERRLADAALKITVDAPNERMETLSQENDDAERSSTQSSAGPG